MEQRVQQLGSSSAIFFVGFEITFMSTSSDTLARQIFGGNVLCCDVYIYKKKTLLAHVYVGVC